MDVGDLERFVFPGQALGLTTQATDIARRSNKVALPSVCALNIDCSGLARDLKNPIEP